MAATMTDMLPYNKQAEEAVLGSILIYPPAYMEAAKYLVADDFHAVKNKWIWNAIGELSRTHIEIDLLTVSKSLEENGHKDDAYLTELVNSTPTAMNCEHYAKIVLDMSKRRQMIQSATELAKTAYDKEQDLDSFIPKYISELLKNLKSDNITEHISAGLSKLYDDIQERSKNPQEIFGLSTGITGVDKITGGFQKGEMVLLSGEPGLGKSLLAMQIAFNFGKDNRPGVIYELEMSGLQTLRRQLSSESGVPVRAMKTGYVTEGHWFDITNALQRMESLPVYLSDSTSWTTASLRADLTRLKTLYNIDFFVVDYLRLLKDRFDGKEPERIGFIASLLHDICKDLDLAGLAIQSMTKEGMKTGGMTGLYGGSEQQHSADVIAVMEKSGKNTMDGKEIINLKFDKHRESDTDKNMVQLILKPGFPSFVEYTKNTF